MEIKFTTDNYPWSIDGLKSCIKDNKLKGVKILAENNYTAAVYIPTYQASVILGAMSDWCISQHKCSWKQYVSDNNNVQIFFFNFLKNPLNELTLVGATYTEKGVMCAFSKGNHPLHEVVNDKNDETALYKKVISNHLSRFIIDESIKNIFKGSKTIKEELDDINPLDLYPETIKENKNEYVDIVDWDDPWYVEDDENYWRII